MDPKYPVDTPTICQEIIDNKIISGHNLWIMVSQSREATENYYYFYPAAVSSRKQAVDLIKDLNFSMSVSE